MTRNRDTSDASVGSDSRRDQALAWFVRMQSGNASAKDRAEHAAWLARDPGNRGEYARLAGVWCDLDLMGDPRRLPARPVASRRGFLGGALAACVAGGGIAVVGLPDFLQSDAYTGTGELQNAWLPDGSQVHLDADTALAEDFSSDQRGIQLQRGRAVFDLANDPRPFRVQAAGGLITAISGRFSVHIWDDIATVGVESSAVTIQVDRAADIRLDAGQRLSFGAGADRQIEPFDPGIETAWLRGKLIFEDRPLRQVLADVNRYRTGTIRVTSDRLLDMRVSGVFDISNPDRVLEAIENTLPVRSTHATRYLVLLRPA